MIGLLHPDEIEAVLHRHHIGHLACLTAEGPYIVPITYVYRGGAVYAHTRPGRKLSALRADGRICFEVEERWSDTTWRSVVAMGIFEEVTDAGERQAVLGWLGGAMPNESRAGDDGTGIIFRLRLTEKTGRFVLHATAARDEAFRPVLAAIDLRAADAANWPRATIGPDGAA
jgi:uncharacterized protein